MSYNDALKLEVSILEALLQRNRCSQSKAKYFQRSSMALRAIHRSQVVDLSLTAASWKIAILDRKKEQTAKTHKSKRKLGETEMWDLSSIQKESAASKQSNNNSDSNSLLDEAATKTLQQLQNTLQAHIPEIISRIEFASQPLLLEISRGFFLPFCTMALGALARIRVLLMRLGHQVLDAVQDVQQEIICTKTILSNHQKAAAKTSKDDTAIISQLFLSAQEMAALRSQFTELPQQQASSFVHLEKLNKLKKSLGFMDSEKKSVTVSSSAHEHEGMDTADTTPSDNATNSEAAAPQSSDDESKEGGGFIVSNPALDDSDIGEAVLSSAPEVEVSVDSTSGRVGNRFPAKRKSPELHANNNADGLVKLRKQKQAKNKKIKEGNSPGDPSSKKKASPAASKETKVKKVKKKKRKKQDFFDNLFD